MEPLLSFLCCRILCIPESSEALEGFFDFFFCLKCYAFPDGFRRAVAVLNPKRDINPSVGGGGKGGQSR